MPLAVLTFLVTVAYAPGLPSNATVGRWWVMGVGTALLLLYTPRLRPTPGHRMLGLLLVWMVLGCAWAVSLWEHLGGMTQWLCFAGVFCLAAEEGDLKPCLRALALGVTVSLPFSLLQWAGYQPVWSIYQEGPVGLFLSKNMAAEVSALALMAALVTRSPWLLPGPALSLYLVGGRTGAASVVAGLFVLTWISYPVLRRELALVAAAGTAVLIGLAQQGHLGLLSDRLGIWADLAPHVNIWGDGLDSVAVAAPGYEFAHNEVLHYSFELGAGVLLLIGVFAYAFSRDGEPGERALLATLVSQCLVWFPLHAPTTLMVGALLAGHLSGLRTRARDAQSEGGVGSGSGSRLVSHGAGLGAGPAHAGGGQHVSPGSQPSMVARAVYAPVVQ